jgi:hypothetical protein
LFGYEKKPLSGLHRRNAEVNAPGSALKWRSKNLRIFEFLKKENL